MASWKEDLIDKLMEAGILQVEEPMSEEVGILSEEGEGVPSCPCGQGHGMGGGLGMGPGPVVEDEVVELLETPEEDTADLVKDETSPEEMEEGSFMSKKIEVEVKNGKEEVVVEVNDNGDITTQNFEDVQEALEFFNFPQDRDQIRNEGDEPEEEEAEETEEEETEEETEEENGEENGDEEDTDVEDAILIEK